MNRRKNRSQNRKKGICSKITAANVYFTIFACVLIYTIAIPVLAMILEHCGEQTEAIITSNTSTWLHRWICNPAKSVNFLAKYQEKECSDNFRSI